MVDAHIGRPPKADLYLPDVSSFTIHPTATWRLMNGVEWLPPKTTYPKKQCDGFRLPPPLHSKHHIPVGPNCHFPNVPANIINFTHKMKKPIIFLFFIMKKTF